MKVLHYAGLNIIVSHLNEYCCIRLYILHFALYGQDVSFDVLGVDQDYDSSVISLFIQVFSTQGSTYMYGYSLS